MTKKLSNNTNQYLANIGVSYIKLHNLHWNVKGLQFKAVHEYLESLYDTFADVLDEIAELLKMDGEMPLASMSEYLSVATIKEIETNEICINDTLHTLLADMEALQNQAKELRKLALEEDNFALANALENHLGGYAKNLWFIRSMLK